MLNSAGMSTARANVAPRARLRRGALADIPVVQSLAGEIWRRHYPGILSREQIEYMLAHGYSRDALVRFVTDDDAGLALAEIDDRPVGFAAWYRVDDATTKLDKLYVLPAHHGAGVGRALIEHVAALAREQGSSSLTLNVNRNNAGAIRAYERCGFAIRSRGDFPIGGGFVMEDFIMVRKI
ncbi:MAG TPA: GNAT family N-acetyltransferase [Casimicrobiaceae bacterium]|nr:GNAT family N-acetyltransferase [Casimicrobiaceae bacterium]